MPMQVFVMKKDRSHWTVRKVTFAEAEELDIAYWADKSIKERVSEATDWIKEVFTIRQKIHGDLATIADGKHLKTQVDEDDF